MRLKTLLVFSLMSILFFNLNSDLVQAEEPCCKRINKADWEAKTHEWHEKMFYKRRYFSIFYFPINLNEVITESINLLKRKKFLKKDGLALFRYEGMFGGYLYIEITDYDMSTPREYISGKFLSRYYEGASYREAGKWMKDIAAYTRSKGYEPKEIISYYATCPECLKKYGSIQTVLFARIE